VRRACVAVVAAQHTESCFEACSQGHERILDTDVNCDACMLGSDVAMQSTAESVHADRGRSGAQVTLAVRRQ